MKKGNEGEKIMGHMFPRLHVNDTEKGRPRAPRRNEMALHEQISLPSQRFSHAVMPHNPSNNAASSVPPSSLVDKHSKGFSQEKLSPSDPSYLRSSVKSQQSNEIGMVRISIGQEGGRKKRENSNESVAGRKPVFSMSHDAGVNLANSVDRLRTDESGLSPNSQSTAAMRANMAATARINSCNSEEALQLEDQNIAHDLSYDSGPGEDGSCRSLHAGNVERGDSVSETSIWDTDSALEITPDDVVGIIGQQLFWIARSIIINQQRVFADQVFELHRLIKVQRSIAASPHLLHDDDAYFDNSTKPSQSKKRPLEYAATSLSNAFKAKGDSENTVEKSPFSSAQNRVPPSSCRPSSGGGPPASVLSSDRNNVGTSHFNHPLPQGYQWLIPVMSPSEGLGYKPCPAPGFARQGFGGYGPPPSNLMVDNFLARPVYGVPDPTPQYPFPSFPPYGPHGYFLHCGMPIMSAAVFSGGSVGQLHVSAQESTSTVPYQNKGTVLDGWNQCAAEEIEVRGSGSCIPSMRQTPGSRVSNSVDTLQLLPSSSPPADASNSSPRDPPPHRAPRVIKVVPRIGVSASESAARILRSIQEERKQFDSV